MFKSKCRKERFFLTLIHLCIHFFPSSSIHPLEIKNWNHLTQTTLFLSPLVTDVVNDVNIVSVLVVYINLFCLHFFFFCFISKFSFSLKFTSSIFFSHQTHYEKMTTKGARIKSTTSSAPNNLPKKTDTGIHQKT